MRPGLAPRCRRTNSPGGSPSPSLWRGTVQRGRCQCRDAVRLLQYGSNVPSPRRGAGFTLDLLSCDPTGLGGGARREEHHPCHCYGMAAAPARAGARPALWQRLQYGGAHWNGTPFYLLLYIVRANVSNSLEPIRRRHRHPLLSYPRTATVRVQNRL
jgi:hypothetical protein